VARLALAFTVLWASGWSVAAEPVRIAVISDMNGSYGSTDYGSAVHDAIDRIIERNPDLVISTGDMVAGQRADPKLTGPDLATMWAAFHAIASDPLARADLPLLVTPGNHDASAYPGFEAERSAFATAWAGRVPDLSIIDSTGWPFRVAVSLRGVLLVGMDATRSGPLPAEEMRWLRRILTAEAGRHQSVVLFGHLPLMPITEGREGDVLADPELFDLAQRMGVDLWLSGHHHGFFSGRAGGILFVSQANLGGGSRRLLGTGQRGAQAFTWIEIGENGQITVSAYSPPDFTSPLDLSTLPETLGTGPFALTRSGASPD
jgi:3',5'-cyclic AMP phosphodiesterase CpdA